MAGKIKNIRFTTKQFFDRQYSYVSNSDLRFTPDTIGYALFNNFGGRPRNLAMELHYFVNPKEVETAKNGTNII